MRNKSARVATDAAVCQMSTLVATGAFNMVRERHPSSLPCPCGSNGGLGGGEVSQTPVVSGSPIISWAGAPGAMGNGDGSPQSLHVPANLPLRGGSENVFSDPRPNAPIKHKAIFRATQAFVMF